MFLEERVGDDLENVLATFPLATDAFHIDVLPEDGGGFTLWLRELEIGGTGADLRAARQSLLAATRSYARDYCRQFDFYRHLAELARQEPYVVRLRIARDDAEMIGMLFGPPADEPPVERTAPAAD